MYRICGLCTNSFEVPAHRASTAKYCGVLCKKKAMVLRGRISMPCTLCNQSFNKRKSAPTKFCSRACFAISKQKTLNGFGKSLRKLVFKRLQYLCCSGCGYDKHPEILGIHHVDHNHYNNNLNNLAVVCANCHSLEHKKHVVHGGVNRSTLSQVFETQEADNAANQIVQ